jgi:hypothetical protein
VSYLVRADILCSTIYITRAGQVDYLLQRLDGLSVDEVDALAPQAVGV